MRKSVLDLWVDPAQRKQLIRRLTGHAMVILAL